MKKEGLYVLDVLDNMRDYLSRADNKFHNHLSMAYCKGCEAIISVGGDYTILKGRDCLGDHHKTVGAPEHCLKCNTNNFIKISKRDMSELERVYGRRAAEVVVDGIKNGLEKMDFPELYNKGLPKIERKWNRFNKQEKIRQVNQLLMVQKKLLIAREKVDGLEKALIV